MCSVDCVNAKTWCDMNEVAPVSTQVGEGEGDKCLQASLELTLLLLTSKRLKIYYNDGFKIAQVHY